MLKQQIDTPQVPPVVLQQTDKENTQHNGEAETDTLKEKIQERQNLEDISRDEAVDDILAEANFSQIFRRSWKLELTLDNVIALLVVLIPLLAFVWFTPLKSPEIATTVRSLADYGFGFGLSILGFLLAGFTIFATLSRPSLFIRMAKMRHPSLKLTQLKLNVFPLVNVFIFYLAFVALCMMIHIFAFAGGPLTLLITKLSIGTEFIKAFIAKAGLVTLGTSLWFVVYQLKSFVFNIYHIVMSGIAWDILYDKSDG